MPAIERRCSVTAMPFTVDETEQYILSRIGELNPAFRGEALPLPDVHPFEMLRRILAYGAIRRLYRSKSTVSGHPQLTRYNPVLGLKICSHEEFYSDAVDNTDAGQPYDFS